MSCQHTAIRHKGSPMSLCLTLQPEHWANTVPFAHACGLTILVVVSPHRLQVNCTRFVLRGFAADGLTTSSASSCMDWLLLSAADLKDSKRS